MTGKLKLLLGALVSVNLLAVLWVGVLAPRLEAAAQASIGRGDYALEVTDGSTFTYASLAEGPSAVFFGFTYCPDVCPTTLGDILTWQEILGDESEDLNIYFMTVDPERDTADVLVEYVGWVPGVVGVTGAPDEVTKAIDAFKVYAAKVDLDEGEYTMDHTASILLFDREGRYSDRISFQEDPDMALGKLRALINS
ncbi:MAG: SCO family protein [Pseudomonadota bacterium]